MVVKVSNEHPEIIFLPNTVSAGFPSPGEDLAGIGIDLNTYMIQNPVATFMVRVAGDSMIEAGILEGDVLVVDRSLTPVKGKIVIAVVDNEFTVKQYTQINGRWMLVPHNPKYTPIPLTESVLLWGVVIGVLRKL